LGDFYRNHQTRGEGLPVAFGVWATPYRKSG
jgi:hypothetical protein